MGTGATPPRCRGVGGTRTACCVRGPLRYPPASALHAALDSSGAGTTLNVSCPVSPRRQQLCAGGHYRRRSGSSSSGSSSPPHRSAKRLRILDCGKAEHHEVAIAITAVVGDLCGLEVRREAAHGFCVGQAAHRFGRPRDVVRPFPIETTAIEFAPFSWLAHPATRPPSAAPDRLQASVFNSTAGGPSRHIGACRHDAATTYATRLEPVSCLLRSLSEPTIEAEPCQRTAHLSDRPYSRQKCVTPAWC
jgi:hypothetical protein